MPVPIFVMVTVFGELFSEISVFPKSRESEDTETIGIGGADMVYSFATTAPKAEGVYPWLSKSWCDFKGCLCNG